jgi:hypothetical protein
MDEKLIHDYLEGALEQVFCRSYDWLTLEDEREIAGEIRRRVEAAPKLEALLAECREFLEAVEGGDYASSSGDLEAVEIKQAARELLARLAAPAGREGAAVSDDIGRIREEVERLYERHAELVDRLFCHSMKLSPEERQELATVRVNLDLVDGIERLKSERAALAAELERVRAVLEACVHEEHGLYNLGKLSGQTDEAVIKSRELFAQARAALGPAGEAKPYRPDKLLVDHDCPEHYDLPVGTVPGKACRFCGRVEPVATAGEAKRPSFYVEPDHDPAAWLGRVKESTDAPPPGEAKEAREP